MYSANLRRALKGAGVSPGAIEAVWPEWWTSQAETSLSAQSQLRFSVARRLGLRPTALMRDEPQFIWTDATRFKNLGDITPSELAATSAFGVALGRLLISTSAPANLALRGYTAEQLRLRVATKHGVSLATLLTLSWACGIPVVYSFLHTTGKQGASAMSVSQGDRSSVILTRSSNFPAQVAFTLAHELGHIWLGHTDSVPALIDIEDPLRHERDDEEVAADRFALTLLTGSPEPQVGTPPGDWTATELADAVLREAPVSNIDPGMLALCVGYSTGDWALAMGALKVLGAEENLPSELNQLALRLLDTESLSHDTGSFLRRALGVQS